jgi:hypothetical protein
VTLASFFDLIDSAPAEHCVTAALGIFALVAGVDRFLAGWRRA